jgi:hypothetical protein
VFFFISGDTAHIDTIFKFLPQTRVWMRYGLNTKRLSRTLHTVVFNIDSSLAAVPVYFFRLWRKLARIRPTSSSEVNDLPLDFCLHRHSVSVNCLHHARMILSVGGCFAYFARNARCTITTDVPVWCKTTSAPERPFSFYIHLHRLATEMWTTKKNNLLEKNWVVPSICTCFVNTLLRFCYNNFF